MALCGPGDLALIPEIYYPVYARSVWLVGAEVSWVPMRANNGFVLDLDAIPEQDAQAARVLIINYPNNPTGARAEREFYDRAVAFARRHNVLLISDLAYSELCYGGEPAPSALEADPECETTIEFHSCSKTFSIELTWVMGQRPRYSTLHRMPWIIEPSSCLLRFGNISIAATR